MLLLVVLDQLIHGVLYLFSYVLDLLVHYDPLIGGDVLQLRQQFPHVDVQHLQLLPEFENSERVLMESDCTHSHCDI